MKTAAEIMDSSIPTVSPDADARSAIELLAKTEKGAIPVVDDGRKVVGTSISRTTSTSWAASSSSAR